MSLEIERKFLVTGDFVKDARSSVRVIQGYLCSDPDRTVRIRTADERAYITIKGKTAKSGISRFEWEKEILKSDALELLKLCEPSVIEKTRYFIESGNHIFEVDVFFGDNEGLIVAEIELKTENEEFSRPAWLGREITGELKYYNSNLSRRPFKSW